VNCEPGPGPQRAGPRNTERRRRRCSSASPKLDSFSPRSRDLFRAFEVFLRLAFLRIWSALLVHTNGWQRSFQPSMKARILALRSLTEPNVSRCAYSEQLPDERQAKAAAFWLWLNAFFQAAGIHRHRRDNRQRRLLPLSHVPRGPRNQIQHRRTRPYRPRPTAKSCEDSTGP